MEITASQHPCVKYQVDVVITQFNAYLDKAGIGIYCKDKMCVIYLLCL